VDFVLVWCRTTVDLSIAYDMHRMVTSLYLAELRARCVCLKCFKLLF